MASVVGAVIGYVIAVAIQNVVKNQKPLGEDAQTVAPQAVSQSDESGPRSRLIVPSKDLGSSSFDEPLDEHPMLKEPALPSDDEIYAEFERPEHTGEEIAPSSGRVQNDETTDGQDWDEPLSLDEFESQWTDPEAADGAWVESDPLTGHASETPPPFDLDQPLAATKPEAVEPLSQRHAAAAPANELLALARRAPEGSALETLRGKRPEDLSLVQMVERFAAALHERQAKAHKESAGERDAALAEGLRALALLAGEKRKAPEPKGAEFHANNTTQAELRDALEKLRDLSGAA